MIRIAAYILLMITCFGCNKSFETPAPTDGDFMRQTCNIHQLKSLTDTASTLPMIIREAIVVQGTVTTCDSAGNIYKALYIEQDEDAMEVKLNAYDIYRVFPPGAIVAVNLQGASLDTAGGILTLGPLNTWPIINRHIKKQPITQSFTPERMTFKEIDHTTLGRTVELCNVEFVKTDTTYSGSQKLRASASNTINNSTSHSRGDSNGQKTLTLYTSPYCTFANEPLPKGSLDVTVLVSIYNDKLQLRINSLNCVHPARDINFEPDFEP